MFFRLDETLLRALLAREHGALWAMATAFSAAGGGWAMVALVPMLVSARTRRLAVWLAVTLGLTALVVVSMKAFVGRGRPVVACADLAAIVCDSPTDPSYPSGHAAGSFAFALFSVRALYAPGGAVPRPRFALLLSTSLVVFAACVGVSRVVLGAHFPSDVVAGAVLGSTFGALAGRRFAAGLARRL